MRTNEYNPSIDDDDDDDHEDNNYIVYTVTI